MGVREKLAFTLFLIVGAVALPWQASAGLVVATLAGRSLVAGLRPITPSRFWRAFLVLSLLVAVMTSLNGILIRLGSPIAQLGPLTLYSGGVEFGLVTGFRLLLIATSFLVLFGSTKIAQLADILNTMGLPTPVTTTMLLAVHFLDHLPERIRQIFIAQESRGAPVRGHFLSRVRSFLLLLKPLVLSSMVESVERGTALELRGFHSGVALRSAGGASRRLSVLTLVFLALTLLAALYPVIAWLRILP